MSMESPTLPNRQDPASRLAARRLELAPYGVMVGPVGHLAAERHRLWALEWTHFAARPQSATIGAEICGLDLRQPLDDAVIVELRNALNEYKVLFFRGQAITPAQHVAFARRFGELEVHPFLAANAEHPELVRFEKTSDTGGYENGWHSDVTWRECPSLGSILRAIEVPKSGGDTLFADMGAAYDGLDAQLQHEIDGLVAVHDYLQVFGHGVAPEQREEMRRQYPQVHHPVVRTHPETGRKSIFVNRFFTTGIVGMDEPEAKALIGRLAQAAEIVEYQCRFQWQPDSLAFWDNRAVQHYASSDYWPDRRVMERATVVGDRPG
jgi:alpha-ketoglutarate-dependent sulfate ester dioxygenase